jgi:hypothetical protein
MANYTIINRDNPVNIAGAITQVQLYFASSASDVWVGVFYQLIGTRYLCRSAENLGSVTSGGVRTFAVNLDAQTGDCIGVFVDNGWIDATAGIGDGVLYVSGNQCYSGSDESYAAAAVTQISIYATGTASFATRQVEYHRSSSILDGVTVSASKIFAIVKNAATTIGQRLVKTSAIDVGIDNYDSGGFGNIDCTSINTVNPSNKAGTLDVVKIYKPGAGDLTGVKIGTFYNVSGNTFTSRDYINIWTISGAVGWYTYSDLSIDIEIGDYIGVRISGGYVGRSSDLTSRMYIDGDCFDGLPHTYSTPYERQLSLYATGIYAEDGATKLVSCNRSADSKIGVEETASRRFNTVRNSSIIVGVVITASRARTAARNAVITIGEVISASKIISYIRSSSIGSGIIISASKAISIIRSSSVTNGIVVTAKGGKNFWKDASVIVGAAITASRIFAFFKSAAVVIGVVVSASAIVSHFGFKVLRLDRAKKIAAISRKFYSLFLDRDDTDADIK